MNKLTALIEAAKEVDVPMYIAERTQDDVYRLRAAWYVFHDLANPATILELCALLEKAEEALEFTQFHYSNDKVIREALAAIKQWEDKDDAIRGMEKST